MLDDTGFSKDGKDSPGVKRQYSGTLGKTGNGQIGVSVHAVGACGTVPLGWALYLPERDRSRRARRLQLAPAAQASRSPRPRPRPNACRQSPNHRSTRQLHHHHGRTVDRGLDRDRVQLHGRRAREADAPLIRAASAPTCKLHGMISIHVLATMIGRDRATSAS